MYVSKKKCQYQIVSNRFYELYYGHKNKYGMESGAKPGDEAANPEYPHKTVQPMRMLAELLRA